MHLRCMAWTTCMLHHWKLPRAWQGGRVSSLIAHSSCQDAAGVQNPGHDRQWGAVQSGLLSSRNHGVPGQGWGYSLHSCSMVAHCSDLFHVWASSSFLVRTASSSKLMLSYKKPKGRFHFAVQLPAGTGFFFPNTKTYFRGHLKNLAGYHYKT